MDDKSTPRRTFLAVRSVSKSFDISGDRVQALHHVDLTIDKGEFVCEICESQYRMTATGYAERPVFYLKVPQRSISAEPRD